MVNERSKLMQKEYKTKHDWTGKVITSELCKILKFHHTTKWYMYTSDSVLENETRKLLWDFEIQTHHLISARQPDLEIVDKEREREREREFARTESKSKRKWKEINTKTITMEHESDSDTNYNWRTRNNPQKNL